MSTNPTLHAFTHAARDCAMQMLSNAGYIKAELPKLTLPDSMSGQVFTVCESLISTQHDVISELFELSELSESSSTSLNVSLQIERIIQWLWEPLMEMHEVVKSLQAAADLDARFFIGSLLVVESATNILNAFNSAKQAADAYRQPQP